MKLPPEIWRFAVLFSHFGQTSSGSAEIFWISSQRLPQAVQTYSYVGIKLRPQCVIGARCQGPVHEMPVSRSSARAENAEHKELLACPGVQPLQVNTDRM